MLKNHERYIITNTDKNVGPCVIELAQYIRDAQTHLSNKLLYKILSEADARTACKHVECTIFQWLADARKQGNNWPP